MQEKFLAKKKGVMDGFCGSGEGFSMVIAQRGMCVRAAGCGSWMNGLLKRYGRSVCTMV